MNTADLLLARERKGMRKKVAQMIALKKKIIYYNETTVSKASKVYKKHYANWNKTNFIQAIKYKQGPVPPKSESSLEKKNKGALQRLYEQNYKGKRRVGFKKRWTANDDSEMRRLEQGEIGSLQETVIYSRALDAQNEFLSTKLTTISKSRRRDVLAKLFDSMTAEERQDIKSLLEGTYLVSDGPCPRPHSTPIRQQVRCWHPHRHHSPTQFQNYGYAFLLGP